MSDRADAGRSRRRILVLAGASLLLTAGVLLAMSQGPVRGAVQELSPVGLQVYGQAEYLCGSRASIRAVLRDYVADRPVQGARVLVRLGGAGIKDQLLFRGATNELGTVEASFAVPDLEPGEYELAVSAKSKLGYESAVRKVQLKRSYRVLLTTDKPIYQPGQTMHLRALALREPSLQAAADQTLALEVSDSKGNKVFKRELNTGRFGIAAADFDLADEVNMGAYAVRAIIAGRKTEKTVTVKRYVLPKFKVQVSTDKAYYLPSETVKGAVQADYFYGKPVSDSKVEVVLKTFDVEFTELKRIEGHTDATGHFEFEAKLPATFVGQPLEQGNAFLQVDAEVTDPTDHTETATLTSSVAKDPIRIIAVPESGALVPGVENLVYVVTSYPDGTPAKCAVTLDAVTESGQRKPIEQRERQTDDLGVCRYSITPNTEEVSLSLSAQDEQGNRSKQRIQLSGQPGLLLRTNAALYRVGDTLEATALTSMRTRTVYFDLVKDRQTVFTTAADVRNGQASVKVAVPAELAGSVFLRAYQFDPQANLVRDTKPVYVEPAGDLQIKVRADKTTYRPGSEAALQFAVTDASGRPVPAALGLSVVDESVFALQELQPGFEKVFFYLEQEIMKPRYEIHGFDLSQIVLGPEPAPEAAKRAAQRRETAARVAFASLELPESQEWLENTYAERVEQARTEWIKTIMEDGKAIQSALEQYRKKTGKRLARKDGLKALIQAGLLKEEALQDPWGRPYKIDYPDSEQVYYVLLTSVGPDGKADTLDDIHAVPSEAARRFARGMGFAAVKEGMPMPAMAAPAGAGAPKLKMADLAHEAEAKNGGAGQVRVREYFPETMYFNPALITDARGRATLTIPLADSITTWRMSLLANSATGQLGSATYGLRVFQDFFVDIDLPVALTQNDQVSIPVGVFNWMDQAQRVKLKLTPEDWFALSGPAEQEMTLGANTRDVRYFTITAKQVGRHALTVHAFGSKLSDAIKRQIDVEPDGKKFETVVSGRLSEDVTQTVQIPDQAIEDASNILVKIYPGIFSQVVEGLDSILRMPFGCFEQTASVTYPNVLVLDYLKRTEQLAPEMQMKAEGFINQGYQRSLTFEVPGGGFSWFGDPPANKMLTAYGIMLFYDMAQVFNVDPALISRTQKWLLGRQEADGSWKPDEHYLHAESWRKIQNSTILPTAYCSWALRSSDCKDAKVSQGITYLTKHLDEADKAYTLALIANAFVADNPEAKHTTRCLDKLRALAKQEGEKLWWEGDLETMTHGHGNSATIETTALAALAYINSGRYPDVASKALNYLIAAKDPRGTWASTQGTVLALRCMVASLKSATQKVNAEVAVFINGERATGFALDETNADVMRLVDCKKWVKRGDNQVKITFGGEGSVLYQIVGRHYLPWKERPQPREVLGIDVKYDKTELAQNDVVTAHVKIVNNAPAATQMTIVDLGIPPGFSVESGDLAELVGEKTIQKFSLTGRQIIVYLDRLEPQKPVEFDYRLRAKFPIKAQTPKSTVYEYYNPDNRADAEPVKIEVKA